MTATPPNWRVALKRGDVAQRLRRPTTSEARVLVRVDGDHAGRVRATAAGGGVDPFADKLDRHGRAHPRPPAREPQPRRRARAACPTRASCPTARASDQRRRSSGFLYGQGDLPAPAPQRPAAGRRAGPAADVRQPTTPSARRSSTRSPRCRLPCNRTTGHRLPAGRTARSTSTPASSASARPASPPRPTATRGRRRRPSTPGTYTYFCRVHPFMRGRFRVKG